MQSTRGVVMATTELPRGVTAVWSPVDQVLVVNVHANADAIAEAWHEVTGEVFDPTA